MAATTRSTAAAPTGCRAISSSAAKSSSPSRSPQLGARIHNEILAAYLADTVKARLLNGDGTYHRVYETEVGRALPAFSAQEFLMKVAEGKASAEEIPGIPPPQVHHHQAKRPAKKAVAHPAKRVTPKEKSAAD